MLSTKYEIIYYIRNMLRYCFNSYTIVLIFYCLVTLIIIIICASIFSQRKPSSLAGEPILGPGARIRSWRSAPRVPITTCSRLPFRVPEAKNRTRTWTRRTKTRDSISLVKFVFYLKKLTSYAFTAAAIDTIIRSVHADLTCNECGPNEIDFFP